MGQAASISLVWSLKGVVNPGDFQQFTAAFEVQAMSKNGLRLRKGAQLRHTDSDWFRKSCRWADSCRLWII